jgi:hypothetical protein
LESRIANPRESAVGDIRRQESPRALDPRTNAKPGTRTFRKYFVARIMPTRTLASRGRVNSGAAITVDRLRVSRASHGGTGEPTQ